MGRYGINGILKINGLSGDDSVVCKLGTLLKQTFSIVVWFKFILYTTAKYQFIY